MRRQWNPVTWILVTVVLELGTFIGIELGTTSIIPDHPTRFTLALIGAMVEGIVALKLFFIRMEYSLRAFRTVGRVLELGLSAEVLEDPKYGSYMESLIRNVARFFKQRKSLDASITELIEEEIKETANLLEHMDENHFIVKLEDIREYGSRFTSLAGEGDEIFATSYVHTPLWWKDSVGQDYLRQKIQAARKGAEIHQVLISPDRESLQQDKELVEAFLSPLITKGSIRIYTIAEYELVSADRIDAFLVKGKVAFKLNLKTRAWMEGFELYFSPSGGIRTLEQYFTNLMKHECLIEFDPSGRHNGVQNFDEFVNKVFAPRGLATQADSLALADESHGSVAGT